MFSTLPKVNFNFSVIFILTSANAFTLVQFKILLFGKELNLSETTYLESPKLKEFGDDNFENGERLPIWVENAVGKGEIACYK